MGAGRPKSVRKVPGRAYLDWIDDRQTMAVIDSVNAASDRGDLLRCAFDPSVPPQPLVAGPANEYLRLDQSDGTLARVSVGRNRSG